MDVDLTDGQAHDLALYFLDWGDNGTRSEQVQISDAATGAVLDTETVSSFAGGEYLDWQVSGNVVITITRVSGPNAVLSGLFFDPTPPTTASLVKEDTATQGNWIGNYGSQGYDVIGDAASLPGYATVTPSGQSTYVWTTSPNAPQALENPGGTGAIAACWYWPTSFTVDVDLTDGQAHDLALYFLDWGDNGRGASRCSSATPRRARCWIPRWSRRSPAGEYLDWKVSGNVLITITDEAGPNAVLSGLFFDPVSSTATATASLIGQNTTTQGSWIGTYGAQGYDVIGDAASLPGYATVTPSGQATYIWAANTNHPPALQNAGGSGRIAACWYAPTSFTVDVDLTDGQAHDLALYFIDWGDNGARSEQVQISNAATGAVLDTETVSSFAAGVYLQWKVSGNVLITITDEAGPNAVLSGLFFDPVSSTATATASLIGQNTTTQGSWIGTYGAQGYDVIGDAASLPGYATVTPADQSTYVWTTSPNAPQALENPGGTGAHRRLLVRADQLHGGRGPDRRPGARPGPVLHGLGRQRARSEQVQINNAVTGAVLDTETVSSFSSGVYLDWEVSGNVVITVTNLSGPNAVLSGIFFDPDAASSSKLSVVGGPTRFGVDRGGTTPLLTAGHADPDPSRSATTPSSPRRQGSGHDPISVALDSLVSVAAASHAGDGFASDGISWMGPLDSSGLARSADASLVIPLTAPSDSNPGPSVRVPGWAKTAGLRCFHDV